MVNLVHNKPISLATLKVGEQGKIQGYQGGPQGYRHKLLAMGLTPGTEFLLLRVAPLGDPLELKVRGFVLSLRKKEAAILLVEKMLP